MDILVNKDGVLERNADILGSQIPQEAVDKAMAGNRTKISLYGIQGIVQCGNKKRDRKTRKLGQRSRIFNDWQKTSNQA